MNPRLNDTPATMTCNVIDALMLLRNAEIRVYAIRPPETTRPDRQTHTAHPRKPDDSRTEGLV